MKLDIRDGLAALGLWLVGLGSAMVYPPAGLIVPGLMMFALACWLWERRD
ncbi:MAG: hypothetical protein QF893_24000 [Alphaproteobacteria bacterium]|nr:hypothetical protein [Alphaproteobacteria bacterium]